MNSRSKDLASKLPIRAPAFVGLVLLVAACTTPDTEGRLAEFMDATSDLRPDGGAVVPDGGSGDFSGTYLLAVKTPLGDAVLFEATVEWREDGGSEVFDLTLQALKTDMTSSGDPRVDARTPTGDPVFTADIPFENGTFSIFYPEITVPADANPIIPDDIVAELTLDGAVITSGEFFCGNVSGELIVPFYVDLTGSTFGAVASDDMVNTEVVAACP